MLELKGFTQVCVWEGYEVKSGKEFEKIIKKNTGHTVKYLETILTNPDTDKKGNPVPETGGRSDIFFAIEDKDHSFTAVKMALGIRWFEDVIMNGGRYLYPDRVMDYWCWVGDERALLSMIPPNVSIYDDLSAYGM
jgi:hypothetical protein